MPAIGAECHHCSHLLRKLGYRLGGYDTSRHFARADTRADLTARAQSRLPVFTWPQSAHHLALVYAHALNLAQSV